MVGTSAGGNFALGNKLDGITLNNAANTRISYNLIAGNRSSGLEILGKAATGNRVHGNRVGTNKAGTRAVGNGVDGVLINNAPRNLIGGTKTGEGNLISGNGSMGIELFGPLTRGNVVEGNAIGLSVVRGRTLPNGVAGIFVNTTPHVNKIGGTGHGQANHGQVRVRFG